MKLIERTTNTYGSGDLHLCLFCNEESAIWLDTVKGDVLQDGRISDGSGEYMPVCIECYDLDPRPAGVSDLLLDITKWSQP